MSPGPTCPGSLSPAPSSQCTNWELSNGPQAPGSCRTGSKEPLRMGSSWLTGPGRHSVPAVCLHGWCLREGCLPGGLREGDIMVDLPQLSSGPQLFCCRRDFLSTPQDDQTLGSSPLLTKFPRDQWNLEPQLLLIHSGGPPILSHLQKTPCAWSRVT